MKLSESEEHVLIHKLRQRMTVAWQAAESALTFDLSGPWRTAKPAGTGPLEGKVSAPDGKNRGAP